jgi:GNAT superfamily N-acetyltransferase
LSLFFVDPEYQRQGIGSLLFQWGLKKEDELGAKIWLTSTPKAASTYERNGWKINMEWIWGGMEAKDFTSGGGCLGSRKGVYELEEE